MGERCGICIGCSYCHDDGTVVVFLVAVVVAFFLLQHASPPYIVLLFLLSSPQQLVGSHAKSHSLGIARDGVILHMQ